MAIIVEMRQVTKDYGRDGVVTRALRGLIFPG